MAIIKKIISVGGNVEKLEPVHCWWECKMLQLLWKAVWQFFKRLNIELHHGAANLLLGIYTQEKMKTYIHTTCRQMLIAALVNNNNQKMETTQCIS